jgi:hypothetical protein
MIELFERFLTSKLEYMFLHLPYKEVEIINYE